MTYLLGVDVGTTRTAAAICRPGAREAEIVNLGDRSSAVPSVLFLATDGTVLVGDAAERRAVTDPDRVVREFKRRVGDPTPINVAGRAWPAQELAARLVRWVVDRVAEREGGPATRIAVTHPASWGTHKKDLLGAALATQGLKVVFLAEPQAAALHYASAERVERGSTIAVYDLGGGTFDAAVVHKDNSAGFALIGRPEGLERVGGIDFDQAVFDHVRAGLPGVFDTLDDSDPAVLAAVARVRRDCTEAKEALSADTEVSIPVLLPESRGSVRLHRSEFEELIRSQVEDTVSALRRAIASAGRTPEQLSAVLLVGGSSRVPLVAQLVSEELGRPVAVDADPKNAIAKGAALALTPNAAGATGANAAQPPSAGDTGATRPVNTAGTGASPARPPSVPPHMGSQQSGAGYPAPGFAGAAALGAGGALAGSTGAAAAGTGGWPGVPAQRTGATAPPPRPVSPGLYHQPTPAAAQPTSGTSASSPATLITIGGLFAAAIVVAVLLLLPRNETAQSQSPLTATTTAPVAIPPVMAPPAPLTTPKPAPPPPRTTARPAPPRTTAPPVVPPPPPTTTTPPPPPTTTDPPPTTSNPPDPTDPPPSTSAAAEPSQVPEVPTEPAL